MIERESFVFGFLKNARPSKSPAAAPTSNESPRQWDIWRRSTPGSSGMDDALLGARLAEAVAWCDSLTSFEDFRSETLKPSLFQDGMDDLVRDLGQGRQHQLRYRKLRVGYELPVVVTGKFMLYFPDENLSDGYAEVVSGGFFDGDNVPAYDTWVSFCSETGQSPHSDRRYLLCYVPVPLIAAADAGIEGNPESCIVWLEHSDVAIRRRVEALTTSA